MSNYAYLNYMEDLFLNTASLYSWHLTPEYDFSYSNHPDSAPLKNIFSLSSCNTYMKQHFQSSMEPVFLFDDFFFLWAAVPAYTEQKKLVNIHLLGPVFSSYTSDSYIKEKMDLDVQVSKLKLLKANHTSQIYRLESDIAKNFPVQISALKERIAGMQIDSQVVKSVDLQDNDTFAMTVGNVLYEDKKEAGEALIAACAGLKTVSTGGKVGEYHGFTLSASYNMFSNAFELTVKGKCSYKLEIGKDPVGNMQRIHNTLSSIDRKLTESEQKLETVQQQLATAQEEVKKPFPKEAELNEKMERLSELNALLNMDEKGNETIMADEDIGREGSNTDSRDAIEEKELPETADRIHKPSILERLKQEKAQQNTAEQPSVQKAAKKKHEQEL